MQYVAHTCTKSLLAVYVKFKFNWASYILFVKPNPDRTESNVELGPSIFKIG